jgi:hypothetical protein
LTVKNFDIKAEAVVRNRSAGKRGTVYGLGLPALLSACSSIAAPTESTLPAGAIEIAAPAIYRDWHQKTQACSGLTEEFSTVKFYVVPGVETFSTGEGQKVGQWIRDGGTNRIIVAGNYQNHEMVVSHELLHSLLNREGHPAEYFAERCKLTWDTWESLGGVAGSAPAD